MSFLEAAKKRRADLLSQEMQFVELPAIEGKVYFKPLASLNTPQKDKFVELYTGTAAGNVDLLIFLARNENGTKMFLPSDKEDITQNTTAKDIDDLVASILREGGKSLADPK